MDAPWWVNLILIVAYVVVTIFLLKAIKRKKMLQYCASIFEVNPDKELTEDQMDQVIAKLLELHQKLRQTARKHQEVYVQASSPSGRGSKLLAKQLQEAKQERLRALAAFNAAFMVACYWTPTGFAIYFHLCLAHQIARENESGAVLVLQK